MKEFRKSDNKDLQKASTGLLWELGLIEIETNQPLDHGHVMLSYSWANQEQVKHIRDMLEEEGFNIWMDIGNISKYTLQSL